MSIQYRELGTGLLKVLAYGSAVSTYILILIGGYVTTSNSGTACGSGPGFDSWPSCNGALFPNLSNPAQVIEYSHRVFALVVAFFVIGTVLLAWTRYRSAKNVVLFSTASLVGLFAQVIRSEEHTSELQSRLHLVCRLLLEKKKKKSRQPQLCLHVSPTH